MAQIYTLPVATARYLKAFVPHEELSFHESKVIEIYLLLITFYVVINVKVNYPACPAHSQIPTILIW